MHPSLMPRKKGTLPSGFARERERGLHAPAGRAEAGRALASRHLGVAHAARDRLLPASRLPVEAYPVDFRTRGPSDIWRTFTFASEGLRRLDLAAKEWAGLVG
jgi:hypothetical protein